MDLTQDLMLWTSPSRLQLLVPKGTSTPLALAEVPVLGERAVYRVPEAVPEVQEADALEAKTPTIRERVREADEYSRDEHIAIAESMRRQRYALHLALR